MLKKVQHISVPKGLPSSLITTKTKFNSCVFYYRLKGLYIGGTIHNFRSRYKEIGEKTSRFVESTGEIKPYSASTVRGKINLLIEQGYCRVNGNHLELVSWWKVFQVKKHWHKKEGNPLSKNQYHKISTSQLPYLERFFELIVVSNNKDQQEYKIYEKFLNEQLKMMGISTKPGIKYDKAQKIIIQKEKEKLTQEFNDLMKCEKLRHLKAAKEAKFDLRKRQQYKFVSQSRESIAKMLGYSTTITGCRRIKTFKKLGFIKKDEANCMALSINFEDFKYIKDNNPNICIYTYKGCIIYRIPNSLEYNIDFKSDIYDIKGINNIEDTMDINNDISNIGGFSNNIEDTMDINNDISNIKGISG